MPATTHEMPTRTIFGVRVECATYASVTAQIEDLADLPRASAVSACTAQLLGQAKRSRAFHDVMARFDVVVPSGFPVIWSLNARGAGLSDRVYGPDLMREVLAATPRPRRHFFFGGTPESLESLQAEVKRQNPDLEVGGILFPPDRNWTEEDEASFARQIRDSEADFIWVSLKEGRQENWIVQNLARHEKGIFLAVGDAFAQLAGPQFQAPDWMRRRGLSWLHRLSRQPRKLSSFLDPAFFLFFSFLERIGSRQKN